MRSKSSRGNPGGEAAVPAPGETAISEVSLARGVSRQRIALILSACNYASSGLGFLTSALLANKLGAHDYGVVSFGLLVEAFCSAVVTFASDKTLVRDLVHAGNRANATFTSSLALRAALFSVAIAAGVAWVIADPHQHGRALVILLFLLYGGMRGIELGPWFDARYEMHRHAVFGLAEKGVFSAAVLGMLYVGPEGAVTTATVAAAYLSTRIAGWLAQFAYIRRTYRPVLEGSWKGAVEMARENFPVFVASFSTLLITNASQVTLERHKGAVALGPYAVAYLVASLGVLLISQLARLLNPGTAEATKPGADVALIRARLRRYLAAGFFAGAAVGVPLILFAPLVFHLFFARGFAPGILPLRILGGWLILLGPSWICSQFVISLRMGNTYMAGTVTGGIVALVLSLWWVPLWGPLGAALAVPVSHSCSVAIVASRLFVKLRKETRTASR